MKKSWKIFTLVISTALVLQPFSVFAMTKEEMVYGNLNQEGKVEKVTIQSKLSSLDQGKVLDYSELSKISNVNGNEKFLQRDKQLTWKSTGQDIYYQGITEKQLPVGVHVKYYLNGKEKKVNKMIGKSGKVKIELSFQNYEYHSEKNLHTPFLIMVSTTLSNQKNKDITVNHGKCIDTGTRNIILGIASPGVSEDLQDLEFDALDQVVIEYETDEFHLNDIYMIATPKLLGEEDLSIFDQVGNVSNSMGVMQQSMNQLQTGSNQLRDGSLEVASASKLIVGHLKDASFAMEQLTQGSIDLDDGLTQIITNLQEAKKVLENKDINGSIENLKLLLEKNEMAVFNLKQANSSLESTYLQNSLQQFQTEQELVSYFSNLGLDDATIQNLIVCKKSYEANAMLIELLDANSTAITSIMDSLEELNDSISMMLTQLENGLTKVEQGASALSLNLSKLNQGIKELYSGSSLLSSGTDQLVTGATSLSAGLTTFNEKGIYSLSQYSKKILSYSNKAKQLIQLSNDYSGYACNNSDRTTFVFKINASK